MKTKYILILCLEIFAFASFGHEQIVHQEITVNAADSALSGSPAFAGFIDVISADEPLIDAKKAMVDGSFDEDFTRDKDPVGGYRSLNHFYDPLTGQGLSNIPLDDRISPFGNDSFTWASIRNCPGINFLGIPSLGLGINVNTHNEWSWQNARDKERVGLTAASKSARQTALADMFRAVGQVVHLLEDTTSPQHVRNEQNLAGSPIEDYGSEHLLQLNYQHGMLDWNGAGFTKMEDFWNRHSYNGNSAALDNAETNGGTQLGLAEWCNGNFLGARHLFPEYFKPGDVEYYPFPSRDHSTDYSDVRSHPVNHAFNFTNDDGTVGKGIYLAKTGDGIHFQHIARVNYLGAKIPGLTGKCYCTIDDPNVLNDYHDNFIPKAVKYSAGLLDYYFRGTLGVSVCNTNITIRNTCGQDFNGGAFFLYKDDSSGNRSYVDQFTLSGTLPSLGTTNVTENDLSTADPNTKYILVYKGSIGATDPVDAGIGIAATTFTPATAPCRNCDGNAVNIQGFNWENTGWPTIFGYGQPNQGAVFISSGTACSFLHAGMLAEVAYLTNSTDCNATINISAHFVWDPGTEPMFWCSTYPAFDMSGSSWHYNLLNGGTDDPQFSIYIFAHSVTPVYLVFTSNGGFSGTFSFNY